MASEHDMRPECAMEFGKITAERTQAAEFREEVRSTLLAIQKEIHVLTGNGNRGKIDEISGMLGEYISSTKSQDHRLAAVEESQRRMDSRMWSLGMKLGVMIGTITVLAQVALTLFK